jgi:hypothetical protein
MQGMENWKAWLEWGGIIVLAIVMAAQFLGFSFESKPQYRPVSSVLESREYLEWMQH